MRKPDLVEHGRERRTGELKRKEEREQVCVHTMKEHRWVFNVLSVRMKRRTPLRNQEIKLPPKRTRRMSRLHLHHRRKGRER
jgi:hypothetical protein